MNKTKIEYVDYSWNPVSGCLHWCEYCYAIRIANRFGGWDYSSGMVRMNMSDDKTFITLDREDFRNWDCKVYLHNGHKIAELNSPYLIQRGNEIINAPYPFGFMPTFYRYRLDEPMRKTKPRKIFVCSMGDLFGDWVPDEWIHGVFQACFEADWHAYLFLTKNPKKYDEAIGYFCLEERGFEKEHWNNMWFGTTVTCQEDTSRIIDLLRFDEGNKFLSIEPLLGPVNLKEIAQYEDIWINALNGAWKSYHPYGGLKVADGLYKPLNWVIIGAQTGPGAAPPKREWIESIVEQCKGAGVSVFMKNSLKDIMGENFIQEWPKGLEGLR